MPSILIVDDEKALTQAVALRLRSTGHDVFTAHNAEQAAEVALRERPNLIILDIDMPPYSGLELQACLKFSDRGRGIPVVILSGQDTDVNRLVAFQQGARDFVSKPIQWPRLLKSIRAILDHSHRE